MRVCASDEVANSSIPLFCRLHWHAVCAALEQAKFSSCVLYNLCWRIILTRFARRCKHNPDQFCRAGHYSIRFGYYSIRFCLNIRSGLVLKPNLIEIEIGCWENIRWTLNPCTMDAQPICTPLAALAVSTYIPWPDDQRGPFWPVNGVTWSISTIRFFFFSFPFLAPRLQRGVPAGQERVAVICLYLLQATWPLLIGSIFFILTAPEMDTPMWYWFVRAYPLCRFPVFMMGCLAGKLMIMHRQHVFFGRVGTPGFELPVSINLWGYASDVLFWLSHYSFRWGGKCHTNLLFVNCHALGWRHVYEFLHGTLTYLGMGS
jgi:hypothetical protein